MGYGIWDLGYGIWDKSEQCMVMEFWEFHMGVSSVS